MAHGRLELTDAMDAVYGAGQWWGRLQGGHLGTDIGPAIDWACGQFKAGAGRGVLHIEAGAWVLKAPPDPVKLAGIVLEGDGSQASQLVYGRSAGAAISLTGANGFTGGGLKGLGILLDAGIGDSTAYGVLMQGNAVSQPDSVIIEDLFIDTLDANTFWYTGFQMWGNARDGASGLAQGIRVTDLRDITIFRCRNVGAYISGVVDLSIVGLSTSVPKVGSGGGDITITGGATQGTKSWHIDGRLVVANGSLTVAGAPYTTDVMVNGTRYS